MDFTSAPHPLLTSATLYVENVPKIVSWQHLVWAFKSCGVVRNGGKSKVSSKPKSHQKWVVHLSDIFHAEMALATLQGSVVAGISPPFALRLSHSAHLESSSPTDPLFSQFVFTDSPDHPLRRASPQDVFRWLRNAGPLVAVRANVNVGRGYPTHVVEYWQEDHANYARLHCQTLCSELQGMPHFGLRTYDPYSVYCSRLGAAFNAKHFRQYFGKFGDIVETRLVKAGTPAAWGLVSFRAREGAKRALLEMKETIVEGSLIEVQYHEPSNQTVVHISSATRPGKDSDCSPESTPNASGPESDATAQAPHSAQTKRKKQEEERLQQQAEQMAARAAEKRKRREAALHKREDAASAVETARKATTEAQLMHDRAEEALKTAKSDYEIARQKWVVADDAIVQAERALEAARQHGAEASKSATVAREVIAEVKIQISDAWSGVLEAIDDQAHMEAEQNRAERETQPVLDEVDEECGKQGTLFEAEGTQHRENEEREKREVEAKHLRRQAEERRAQADEERKAREEAERVARERREREEQEDNRQKIYQEASATERSRCKQRDASRWNMSRSASWSKEDAVARFRAVNAEFDEVRFCDTRPLTLESVPWPVLRSPLNLALEDITWNAVEGFFRVARVVVGEDEYKTTIIEAHQDDLQKRLEDAGNVVAQAITPLWLASKAR